MFRYDLAYRMAHHMQADRLGDGRMSEHIYWADSDGLYKREEIVRCRDCRYMEEAHGIGIECWRIGKPFTVWTDGFCAWGEKRGV